MAIKNFLLSTTPLLFLAIACTSDPPIVEETAGEATEAVQTAAGTSSWSYSGDKGPDQWASLSPENSACGTGRAQSPINLVWRKPKKGGPRVDFNYSDSQASVENAGYTARIKMGGSNQLLINGQAYNLEKIEFHSPSEHQLSGTPLSLEIQMVHKSMSSDEMVSVSLFAIEGRENALLKEVMAQMAGGSGFQLNATKLLPPRKTFYHYQGSMTTPPCTENMNWILYNTPMELSREQIMAFRSMFPQNNRPLQPLNGRSVQNH